MHNTAGFTHGINTHFDGYDVINIETVDVVNNKEVYLTYTILGGPQCSTICKYKSRTQNWDATSTDIRVPFSRDDENELRDEFVDILPHNAFRISILEGTLWINWSSRGMDELYTVLDAIDSESELFVE